MAVFVLDRVTGMALVRESAGDIAVLNLFDLIHRGRQISEALTARRNMRRRRRSTLRYRAPRFLNRGNKNPGWLAPSLQHRVETTLAWRFDMQALENPEIEGVEYQRGTLFGTEVREYLLAKWNRTCAYCDATGVPLNLDHIQAKARNGSNRVSNLALSCVSCNLRKDARDIRQFLAKDPKRLDRILAQAKRPLKDAAAVNSTRWALFNALKQTGLSVEASTGGRTKWNRSRLSIPKTHALDAACVGDFEMVAGWQKPTLAIKCTGRGSYRRTRLNAYGFPRGYLIRQKAVKGFQTGDLVVATVNSGSKIGVHTGRVAVRRTGSFNIQTATGAIQGINHKPCRLIQRNDGYGYLFTGKLPEILPRPRRVASPEGRYAASPA